MDFKTYKEVFVISFSCILLLAVVAITGSSDGMATSQQQQQQQQSPPNASDDTASTTMDRPVTVDVLANDIDPDGDELYVRDATTPQRGSVVINNQDGSITYTPDSGFTGIDRFQYTVIDGNPLDPDSFAFRTDTAVVRIEVMISQDRLPTINLPPNLPVAAEATKPSGADVSFTVTATSTQGQSITPLCNPQSDDTFPLGSTQVTCTAIDTSGLSTTETFTVIVRDTTAPVLDLPADITEETSSSRGTSVSYSVSASDIVDGNINPVCAPPSGSIFAQGDNIVTCEATDSAGNTASGSFLVSIVVVGGTTTTEEDITLTIDSIDIRQTSDTSFSVDIGGTISKSSSDSVVVVEVDWDDGTASSADLKGGTWSAAHEYGIDHAGTEKTITSSLIVTGSPVMISEDRSIIIPDPSGDTNIISSSTALVILGIAGSMAGAGVILAATKSGTFKQKARSLKQNRISDEKKKDSTQRQQHSVRLEFRYGIENLKEIDASMQKSQLEPAAVKEDSTTTSATISSELEQEFKSMLGEDSLQSMKNTLLQHAKQAKDIADFCTSAAQNPDQIITSAVDAEFKKMVNAVSPLLSSLLIKQLSIKSQIQSGYSSDDDGYDDNSSTQAQKALFDVDLEMQPIRPFIEAVLLVNNIPTKVISIVFQFDSLATINKAGWTLKNRGTIEWKLENIRVDVSFTIAKITARLFSSGSNAGPGYSLNKQVSLTEKEFYLKEAMLEEKQPDLR